MKDWNRLFDEEESEAVAREQARKNLALRIGAVAVLTAVALMICVFAFARQAQAEERFSVPYFHQMEEKKFAQVIVMCRSDKRYADTSTCGNAELAFERRYADVLRRNRIAMMQSPMFWAENRFSALNVLRACGAGERWAMKWCGIVESVYENFRKST